MIVARARVLVVDDDAEVATVMVELLEQSGYSARAAYDGLHALAVAAAFLPDVVLLDLALPIMDGYELARRLRELPALRQVRLIALTGYGLDSDRSRSYAQGFTAHVVKPIGIDNLRTLLSQLAQSTCSAKAERI